MSPFLRQALCLLLPFALACSPAASPPAPSAAPTVVVTGPGRQVPEPDPLDETDPGPIPITSGDPAWGRNSAPVTIVEFGDFQCPFCSRVAITLNQLREKYGPERLRVVWKNNPLPFHNYARPAAGIAMTLFQRSGPAAFWETHDAFFADVKGIPEAAETSVTRAGTTLEEVRASAAFVAAGTKIDADVALAKSLGVSGVPMFFINGVALSGAQPLEKFVSIIDEQLKKAHSLVAAGIPARRVYAELTKVQKEAAPKAAEGKPELQDTSVWAVPVGKAPVRGKATALVTIIEFSEFQCPFCGRVASTLQKVAQEYGDKVRLVFKHNPLPFHANAPPAAELAVEARAQKGDAGFWAAHDLLFKESCDGDPAAPDVASCKGTWVRNQSHLEEADLLGYAKILGLDVARLKTAISTKKHAPVLEDDMELADDFAARGTPQFFINGRRLVGAQPLEQFRVIINEELSRAEARVKQGVPPEKLYESLVASGKKPAPPETKQVPPPTRSNPSRGSAQAKVVVQMFSDFQCPFCKRVMDAVDQVESAFPGKVRVVWRHRPLAFHAHAEPAAEAAMEAYDQKGDAGFWAMSAKLFEHQGDPDGLGRPALESYAAELGLNRTKFTLALDTQAHHAAIEADAQVADAADISGTPAFVINGLYVSGAQPFAKFKKVIKRALAEVK